MRSSEASGAGALGFRVGKTAAKRHSINLAVAVTAFLAAGLFVLYDASRTYEHLAVRTPATAGLNISQASLTGSLAVPENKQTQAFTEIVGRGAIAFAFAGMLTAASSRRRKPAEAPDSAERHRDLLNTIREEQRQLARRYHEEKLKAEAASRAKTNFLAHLSHDIRTPLNHIIGFAELMEHETYGELGDARYRDYVQTIKSSGQHLLNSFATILDLAELEGGQKPLRQDPVLLDEVMESVEKRFAGQIQRAGLRFKVGPATGAVLRGDRLGMMRMIGNFVDNAIRFTRSGGTITLAAFAAEDGVVIEVSDTGIGMSEARLASLSQPFATGDASFARNGQGPGLGISIARAIAEQSGGHVAIDSAPALGTTVAISLPTEPAAANLAA